MPRANMANNDSRGLKDPYARYDIMNVRGVRFSLSRIEIFERN